MGHQRIVKHKDRWLGGPHKRHVQRGTTINSTEKHNVQKADIDILKKHTKSTAMPFTMMHITIQRHDPFCNGAVNKRKKKKNSDKPHLVEHSGMNSRPLMCSTPCRGVPSCSKIAFSLLAVKEISCFCLNRNI